MSWLRRGLLLCAAAWLVLRPALAAETIRWVVHDMPPVFSLPGGHTPKRASEFGHGELDGLQRLLVARLPQFQHEFVVAVPTRFEALVRQGEPICSLLPRRTPERLSWLYFTPTHPPLNSRAVHLVTRAELLPRLNALGTPLSLARVLQEAGLQGVLTRDRSFGPRIDQLLQTQGQALLQGALAWRGQNLLSMLQAGRMDYTLEHPVLVDEYLRQQGSGVALVKLPLLEAQAISQATVACARNPAGRRHIEAIDAVIRALARAPDRSAWLKEWLGELPEPGDRERIDRFMDARARRGAQIE
ncbi:hypothetical protein [Inhella proteolytica]|uniref:Solute-binding protein family 3/N-terminal domain-containing protein n=1 Tax=Inhella proteolytica TaxID=2795029 RepID=A0A931NF18_9BURK|nr:hypothetical protein [Inhella proteolytica]MBH9578312.1 hypothetical protein [Inhella proteolytica]